MAADDNDPGNLGGLLDSLATDFSRAAASRQPRRADGAQLNLEKLPVGSVNYDRLPGDPLYAVEAPSTGALLDYVLARNARLATAEEALGPIPTVVLMPDDRGQLLRKRVGERRYGLWLATQQAEARISETLAQRNAALQLGPESRPTSASVAATPAPGFWARVKTFFRKIFSLSSYVVEEK